MKRENIERGAQIHGQLTRLETNHKQLIKAETDVVFLIFGNTDDRVHHPVKMQLTAEEADIVMSALIENGQLLREELSKELEAL
ncbi:MAG: hypothetical protein WBL80_03335 [Erysipelotrichaceae bacterium]